MNIGYISIYPPKKLKHAYSGGVASYTKNLVQNLPNKVSDKFYIFCDRINKKEIYQDKKVKVIRCWTKNSPKFIIELISAILKNKSKIDLIHFQQELFLFGNIITSILQPILLIILKISGKKIVSTIHGVVSFRDIHSKFVKENNYNLPPFLAKIAFLCLFEPILWISNAIIVHEKPFKRILIKEYKIKPRKISVIPHGIESLKNKITHYKARKLLKINHKLILFFGYLSGYKGLDVLIGSFQYLNKNYQLIIAGGLHPRLRENKIYRREINRLKQNARKISPNIFLTGFIQEQDIEKYFQAADLIIFPYTIAMSASGPLAFALSYQKPFLISEAFRGFFQINSNIFKNNPEDLASKINQFFNNQLLKREISKEIKRLRKIRIWSNIALNVYKLYQKYF